MTANGFFFAHFDMCGFFSMHRMSMEKLGNWRSMCLLCFFTDFTQVTTKHVNMFVYNNNNNSGIGVPNGFVNYHYKKDFRTGDNIWHAAWWQLANCDQLGFRGVSYLMDFYSWLFKLAPQWFQIIMSHMNSETVDCDCGDKQPSQSKNVQTLHKQLI